MSETRRQADAVLRDFILTDDVLLKVSALLLQEFNNGLNKKTRNTATIKMIPTFVRDVPDGSEQGKFLALDLGGTNFRVLCIDLHGNQCNMLHETYEIPESIMRGSGEQLFDHIAECLEHYLETLGLSHRTLPLGFTFSFPCEQKGLTSALLLHWTKGFDCSGVQGKDVVQLLREAVKRRRNVDIDVVAIVNDTTGTLMSCAHKNRECRLGLIVGTGTNACYMERLENVETWTGDNDEPQQVVINTEWGAFGDNGCLEFLRTPFDREIDQESLNKGKQLFEKMISGMYMGEIVRKIVVKLAYDNLIFNGNLSEKFKTRNTFKSKYVSNVESDPKQKYNETMIVMEKMMMTEVTQVTDEDCETLKLVCTRVSTRAAHLVSAAVATVLNKMQRFYTTVGVDGSVYRYHPHFKDLMEKKIDELTNPNYKFNLMLSEDGSGRGAALVAAVAVRSRK